MHLKYAFHLKRIILSKLSDANGTDAKTVDSEAGDGNITDAKVADACGADTNAAYAIPCVTVGADAKVLADYFDAFDELEKFEPYLKALDFYAKGVKG